jgi:nucleotide-binding universal stress UspA family protein
MYRKILVPLDGSEVAEEVLPEVERLAKACGATLLLYHVLPHPHEVSDEFLVAAKNEATRYLEGKRAELVGRGFQVEWEIDYGDAAEKIVERAGPLFGDVDIIAMSTHGRSGLARVLIGSVFGTVLRRTDKPFLVKRATKLRD